MQQSKRLSLRLLGGFELVARGDPPMKLRIASRKGRALIAYLAVEPDHCVSREQAATLLWGNRYDVQARQDLRQCLVSLRRALATAAPELLFADAANIGIRLEDLSIDALELTALAARKPPDFDRAAALYRGQFLAGVNLEEPLAEWLASTRFRFDTIVADIFETCAKSADHAGNGQQAIDAAERLIGIDSTREDWQRLVLQFYARYRGRETALTHANRMIARVKHELGVDVEAETKQLINEIRRGAISLAQPAKCVLSQSDESSSPAPAAITSQRIGLPHWRGSQEIARHEPTQKSASGLFELWTRLTVSNRKLIALVVAAIPGTLLLLFAVHGQVDKQAPRIFEPISYTKPSPLVAGIASSDRLSGNGLIQVLVLPFLADDDSDARAQVSASVITEDLTNALTQNSELKVGLRGHAEVPDQVRPLDSAALRMPTGLHYIIDGAVRSEGSRLHVNVGLMDVRRGVRTWSDQFVQENSATIVARLARELPFAVTLARSSGQNAARESEFEHLILNARATWLRASSRENTDKEVDLFEQALRRSPDLPAAQLGLAMALIRATLNSLMEGDPQRNLDRAEALLNKVLLDQPNSYRAEYWRGLLHKARASIGGGFAQYHLALTGLKRALELNPNASYIHGQIGAVLVRLGRPQGGLDEIRYAIDVNPKDPSIGFFYLFAGEAELELGHDAKAIEWLKRAAECAPHNPRAYQLLSASYALIGDRANMEKNSAEFRRFAGGTAYQRFIDRLSLSAAGDSVVARSRISQGLRIAFAPS